MKRAMDIGKKILGEIDKKPGDTFSVSAIASAVGATPKATAAALGRLFKAGLVTRPQKGIYSSKGGSPRMTAAPEPEQAKKTVVVKTAKPTPKIAQPAPAPTAPLSIITIDLLIEGEPPKIDASGFLGKLLDGRGVLDARVRKITAADQSKLQIRFAFTD